MNGSGDWRLRAKEFVNRRRQKEEEERKRYSQKAHDEFKREEDRKLKNLQRKFKCRVCGKLPTIPILGGSEQHGIDNEVSWDDNWDIPGDLSQCSMCRGWACEEHIESHICQTCAEKL